MPAPMWITSGAGSRRQPRACRGSSAFLTTAPPILRRLRAVGDAGAAVGVVELAAVVAVVLLRRIDPRLPIPRVDAALQQGFLHEDPLALADDNLFADRRAVPL